MKIKNPFWIGITLLALAGCGGGGGADQPPVSQASTLRSGQVDASYGTNGLVQFAHSEGILEMAVGQDGSVFLVGGSVRKLLPDGSIDLDYGQAGFAQAGFVGLPAVPPVVDAGGSLYVAKTFNIGHAGQGMDVTKLAPSGRPDPSFGFGGHLNIGSGSTPHWKLNRLALDLQGNLYVAGLTGAASQIVVSKFGPDGRLDPTFGTSGSSIAPAIGFSSVEALAVDDQLSVAIGGMLMSTAAGAPARPRIIKLDRAGAPVAGFGNGGVWSPGSACSSTYIRALAPLPSGELLWGGSCLSNQLLRATLNEVDLGGNDVASFHDGGFSLFGSTLPGGFVVESQWVTAILRGASDNLYAAGQRRGGDICVQGAVAKLDASGNAIADFGVEGSVAFDAINEIRSIGMDAAGRLYLGGTHFTSCSDTERPFVVYRLGG